MQAQILQTSGDKVAVPKDELIRAWSVLEKLVISLRNMGSYYSTPDRQTPLSSERHAEMLAELDQFFSPELIREMNQARIALGQHLPEEEAEHLADHLIHAWSAPVSAESK